MRRGLLITLILAVSLLVPSFAAAASAPTVTLTNPANGALINTGQPDFSGSAGDSAGDSGRVIIDVYAGASATAGVPVEILHTSVTGGDYSAKAVGLHDGTYTAVATEADTAGDQGSSQPVTFDLFNASPQLTLTAPNPPIRTPAPTFTGTAQGAPGDAGTVSLIIYPGTSTDATPLAVLSGPVSSTDTFSIQVLPGLGNGTYTAVASQQLSVTTTFSPPVQFKVASTAPALTVTAPRARASEPQTDLMFTGAAGDAYGDASAIHLTLYAGTQTSGRALGAVTVTRTGDSWSEQWPTTLGLGTYTLAVSQSDVADSTTTVTRTFTVAPPGSVTGAITISRTGKVSATLVCLPGAGTCTGDVLIVTASNFQPQYGGPDGPLHLMFDRYSVAAGHAAVLTDQLTGAQLTALRRARATKLVVTVAYQIGTRLIQSAHRTGAVKVG